jgi:hypothetical protein
MIYFMGLDLQKFRSKPCQIGMATFYVFLAPKIYNTFSPEIVAIWNALEPRDPDIKHAH